VIDPFLSLALAVHAAPSRYALLLGSGVSQPAGIPTGWGVVRELIEELADAAGEGEAGRDDPERWFQERFGIEPSYSALLDAVARTPAERQHRLRRYFDPAAREPDATEPAGGAAAPPDSDGGLPTRAHRAVASLAASGHVRVVLTTNFDTLLEAGLNAESVPYTVISSGDDAEGANPLVHGGVLVVKLHGDYRDERILNTREELSSYDPRMRKLLDRILGEFGLIVCGWSGDWDIALRRAISRTAGRRYTMFWAARDSLTRAASRLVQQREAQVIPITDADAFLGDLADRVHALADIDAPHPLAAPVHAAALKRHLSTDAGRIRAHDLALAAADAVRDGARLDAPRLQPIAASPQSIRTQVELLDGRAGPLAATMATGCYWGARSRDGVWLKVLTRAYDVGGGVLRSEGSGDVWNELRYYPAMLALYAGGMASIEAGRWDLLATLLTRRLTRVFVSRPAVMLLHPVEVLHGSLHSRQFRDMDLLGWLSEHLYETLKSPLGDVYADPTEYRIAFDRFEYLTALVQTDLYPMEYPRADVSYGAQRRFRRYLRASTSAPAEDEIAAEVGREAEAEGAEWPALAAGLFGGSEVRLDAARTVVERSGQQPRGTY
jgi:hypothetical protein